MAQSPIDIAKQTGMSLQQVLQQIGRDSGWGDQYLDTGPIVDANGMTWLGNGDGTYNVYQNDPNANNSPAAYNGRAYDKYNAAGEKIGSGTLSGYKNGSFMSDWGPFAMVAAGMAPALMGAGAAGAGAGAGASGVGGGSGAFLGEGMASGIPAWDAAAINSGLSLTAPAAATAGLTDAATTAATSSGVGNTLSQLGSAAKGVLNAIPGGLGTLGLLAGAAAGAQGVKQTQNTSQHTDPRVDPYIFGTDATTNPGLLNLTQQQLMNALSPATMAGWDSIKSKGMGLMNQPVAQNGFNLLTKGRYQ